MKKAWCLLSGVLLLSSPTAWALNVQRHRPTTGATGGYLVHTAETLGQGQLAVGFDSNFSDDTYEASLLKPLTNQNVDLVDQLATFDFLATVGLLDWLNMSIDIPVHFFSDINGAPLNSDGTDNYWDTEVGDLLINLKARILDSRKGSGLGLALIPFITTPSGQSPLLEGDLSPTGGVVVAFEKVWEMTRLYANVGGKFREFETVTPFDQIKHEFLYGAGLQHTLSRRMAVDWITEITGSTTFHSEIASPAEFVCLMRKTWGREKRYLMHGGAGLGMGDGYGSPDWRMFGGMSYVFGGQRDHVAVAAGEKQPTGREIQEGKALVLTGIINFKTASAALLPESDAVLDDAVAKLQAHPEILLLEIAGHTDSRGDATYNLDLSQRRANAVKKYFVKKGIDASRLMTQGYGETQPIASNETPEGRQENRRIVLQIAKMQ